MPNLRHEDDHEFGRVYHITDAVTPSLKKQPRMHTRALSDCVCYDADGNVIRTIARKSATTTRTRTRKQPTIVRESKSDRINRLLMSLPSIHEGDV